MVRGFVGDGSGRKAEGVIRNQKNGQGEDPLRLPNHSVRSLFG